MIWLSESNLDASVSSDNHNLNLNGYKLVRADHHGNVKRGGVSVYFKESSPVRYLLNSYLKECLIPEVSINNKRGYVVSLYRWPSQTSEEFDSVNTNLEKTVEGAQSDYLTSLYGMKQVLTKLAHILESSASWIDLIFTN